MKIQAGHTLTPGSGTPVVPAAKAMAATSLTPGSQRTLWFWPSGMGSSCNRLRSWAPSVGLALLGGHLLLTCFSTRYVSAGGVLLISPSWALATLALLVCPASLLGWQREASSPVAGNAAPCSIPQEHMQGAQQVPGQQGAPSSSAMGGPRAKVAKATFAFVKKLARKVLQPGRAPIPVAPEETTGRSSFLRRFSNATAQGAERAAGGKSLWRRQARPLPGSTASRWQPSMTRITSGQHLDVMHDDTASNNSMSASRQRSVRGGLQSGGAEPGPEVPLVPHAGHLAVDCIHHDTTLMGAADVTQIVTNQHLLQFGALLGESSAELALTQAGAPPAQSPSPGALLGATDNQAHWGQGWEQVVQEDCRTRGIHYCAWRRYIRKGLFMYKSRTVIEGITPQQLAAFYFDERYKRSWDDAHTEFRVIPPPAAFSASTSTPNEAEWVEASCARSAYMYARTKFPAPMAQREYVYVRRVWAKADDGGCYAVFKSATHPSPPAAGCRTVKVQDFSSGVVIRESVLGTGSAPAAEMVTVYFEDSHVSPGIMNIAVRKALWPGVQKMEAALRQHVTSTSGQAMQVVTSNVLKQACMAPLQQQQQAGGLSGLRRCMSAAGSRRCSLDGMADTPTAGAPGGLHPILSTPILNVGFDLMPFHKVGPDFNLAASPRAGGVAGGSNAVLGSHSRAGTVLHAAGVPVRLVGRGLWLLQAQLVMVMIALARLPVLLYARLLAGLLYIGYMIRTQLGSSGRPAGTPPPKEAALQSHPLTLGAEAGSRQPNGPRKLGRKIAARLALLAVRVSVPIAHHVLKRTTSGGQALNGYESVSSQMGTVGVSTRAQHVGNEGRAAGTHASRKESAARVVKWLDCLSASLPADYMGGQHAEIVQQQMAMLYTQQMMEQQQQESRQRALRQRQVSASAGGALPSRLHTRSSLGSPLVVDGVMMPW